MKIVPDFEFSSTQEHTELDYIHRSSDKVEIYFVANRFGRKGINDVVYRDLRTVPDRYEQVECTFRVTGMQPEYFNPLTGEHQLIKLYREENGQTLIPLSFGPEESKFIVFTKTAPTKYITALKKMVNPYFRLINSKDPSIFRWRSAQIKMKSWLLIFCPENMN